MISRDGSVVVFESAAKLRASDTNPDRDVYAYRLSSKQLLLVSVSSYGGPRPELGLDARGRSGDRIAADSTGASVSADGRHVAFVSFARDLVPGEMTGAEVYVRDLVGGTTRCVPALGAPGRPSAPARSIPSSALSSARP